MIEPKKTDGVTPDEIRDILQGTPFGTVFPPKENPHFLTRDARTAALAVLKKYISFLTFFRPGNKTPEGDVGEPIPFSLPLEDIHIEWPDYAVELRYPSVVFLSLGRAKFDAIGLTAYLDEKTADLFAPGTAFQVQNEYTENFAIEIWANKKPERRSILAGLEVALTPSEQYYGLRLKVREYYNQYVMFTLMEREIFDEADAALGRRRARLYLEMRIITGTLVNFKRVEAMMKTEVDVDQDTGSPVDLVPTPCCVEGPDGAIDNPDRPFPSPTEPVGPSKPFNPC